MLRALMCVTQGRRRHRAGALDAPVSGGRAAQQPAQLFGCLRRTFERFAAAHHADAVCVHTK